MVRSGFIFIIVASILLSSCLGDYEKKADPNIIYFDYIVSGDEESGHIIIKLQYWLGGKVQGKAFRLHPPAGVTMDGDTILADSAAFNGVYYEVIYESDGFAGFHTIMFTDPAGKRYRTSFDFPVFTLQKELPAVIGHDTLNIQLAGLTAEKGIRVILTDTSFYGKGVEKVDTVKTGRIVISPRELGDLENGPVHLELLWEEEKHLQGGPDRPGRIYTSYRLQREFLLQDSVEN
jgi:hypothetical protein